MEIGRYYNSGKNYIDRVSQQITDYIISKKDDGYLLLDESMNIDRDTIVFWLGQDKFVLQIISLHLTKSILYKTYRLPKFPETRVDYIEDMEIKCSSYLVHNSLTTYKVPKIHTRYEREFQYTTVENFNEEYFYFLEQYINSLYI